MINSKNIKYQTITSAAICVSLSLFFGFYFNIEFLKYNSKQIIEFLLSAHFLFFVFIGCLLHQKWTTDKWFNYLVFISAATYSMVFYGKHLDVFRMAGDNICQIAYWDILFHPNLTGSIGASFTKPGQLLILGILYQLSLSVGPLLFKAGLSLVMAACIWSLVRVATDIGGRTAGVIAFPVAVWAFVTEFLDGSSSIFLIPCLFIGIWLYFYKPEFKSVGRILIVLSVHFHIQSISVMGIVWLILLFRKDWKELTVYSLYSAVSVFIWALVIYRIQGAIERLNSGAGVGYVGPLEGIPENGLAYMLGVVREGFVTQSQFRLLIALGIIGILGAIFYGYKIYLTVFASILVLIVNVLMLGGTFNIERYCSPLYAFSCALGIGAMVRYAKELKSSETITVKLCFIVSSIILIASLDFAILNYPKEMKSVDYDNYPLSDYIVSARKLLSDPIVQDTTRLMTEDDIIYSLVVMNPDRFRSLAALQYFNVVSVPVRKSILANIDHIWIALNNGHLYYYLSHMPVPEWERDSFRAMIIDILRANRPASLYGFSFVPVDRNADRLILKVMPEQAVN